eukprot:5542557-Pyramimonas_sp.AAC.1
MQRARRPLRSAPGARRERCRTLWKDSPRHPRERPRGGCPRGVCANHDQRHVRGPAGGPGT